MAFPNAVVRAEKRDADYWLSEANLNAATAERKNNFQNAQASLDLYIKAGRFKTFQGDALLTPGITALARPVTRRATVFMAPKAKAKK